MTLNVQCASGRTVIITNHLQLSNLMEFNAARDVV